MQGNGHDTTAAATTWDSDFLTDFLTLAEGQMSPRLFKLWSGISLLAGALERRVWIKTWRGPTYPNLYVMLVASPGIGKFVIELVKGLWEQTLNQVTGLSAFSVAPDNMTKASLLDRLAASKRTFIPPVGPIQTFHSLLIAAEEFSVLMPSYDTEYLGVLNGVYNVKASHSESRRTGAVKDLIIDQPLINILAGYQPALMATTFPEEAWSSGLSRRLIMVYSNTPEWKDLSYEPPDHQVVRQSIIDRLGKAANFWGVLQYTTGAFEMLKDWDAQNPGQGGTPVPQHSKLTHYTRTRSQMIMKLSIVSSISRAGWEGVVREIDVDRAVRWLTEAEVTMPDIFREMVGKSDIQVIEEMHSFIQAEWSRTSGGSIDGEMITRFLARRLPSERVKSVFELASASNIIARVAGTDNKWVPRVRPADFGLNG